MHLTKTTAAQNEITLSYHKVRGLYFLAVFFAVTKVSIDWPLQHKYQHISAVKNTIKTN